jgi:prevent-host-death family protein
MTFPPFHRRSTGRVGRPRPVEQVVLAQYNSYDARTFFSQLLDRVREGEQIVIARAGMPIAKLVPYEGEPRRLGLIRTQLVVHDARRKRR